MKQENSNFDEVFDEISSSESDGDLSAEEVRKKAHGADSMRGRLEKEKEKARQLEDEIRKKAEEEQGQNQPEPEKDTAPQQATGDDPDGQPGPAEKSSDESGNEAEAPEESGQDQPAGDQPEQDRKTDQPPVSEKDRKKAIEYELVVERLRAQQERNRQLEAMLRQSSQPDQRQGRETAPGQGSGSRKPAYKKADIPEELAEDARDFQEKYPDYYRYLEEDSPVGRRMRNALRDYGPDQAALIGETRLLREEIEATRVDAQQKTSELARKIQEDETRKHFAQVAEKHPEMAWKDDPDKKADWESFIGSVYAWIEELPYRQATQAMQIAKHGNTQQVVDLLDHFKKSNSGSDQGEADQPAKESDPGPEPTPGGTAKDNPPVSDKGDEQARKEKEKLIKAAEAIASRPAPPRSPRPDVNDFDSAWEEAVGDKR